MVFADKKCMCIDLEDPSKCKSTGQTWVNSPDECKTCPPTHISLGYYLENSIFVIIFLLTFSTLSNVLTKTVKF